MGKASEKLWELEARIPKSVKKHTDKIIVRGAKTLRPLRQDAKKRGEAWYKAQRKKLHI